MGKIIIYGAGNNCKNVVLKATDKVVCIADKNPAKAQTTIGDLKVISPDQISSFKYDKIIVSVVGKFEEIREQLVGMGIEREKIISWEEYITVSPKNIGTMIADWSKGLKVCEVYEELCSHADELSAMEKEFLTGKHNRSFKWLHYFEIYNRHFAKYIGKDVTIMEIGVNKGGSLQIWKKIFGPNSKIIGIDINPACKEMEDDQISIYIGDQADRGFWKKIKDEIPKLDILIDDGGHYMEQQIITFEEMFPHVKDDGVYLCEDTTSSYSADKYNSGYKKSHTYIEYSKNFIDYIHAWFSMDQELQVNEYTKTMHSLHYYCGVVAVEKKVMHVPFDMEVCNTEDEQYAICHFYNQV